MILQALTSYYDRLSADPHSDIASPGWAKVEIPFILVINQSGALVGIEDTREKGENGLHGKLFIAPQPVKRSSGIAANLLWDTMAYVTGLIKTEGLGKEEREKASSRAAEQHNAFMQRIAMTLRESPKKQACLRFLSVVDNSMVREFDQWDDIIRANANLGIRFQDDLHLYCQDEDVTSVYPSDNDEAEKQRCLVTGELDTVSQLHTAIKGVYGAQSVGANIVSFNLDPFVSYGKKQGANAPIGEKAMFAYTTALNTLLARGSRQRMQVGDASTVFWSEKESTFESDFYQIFAEPPKDDPHANSQCIRSLFDAPKTGEFYAEDESSSFFVLGLSPNAARLFIRFWLVGQIAEFASNIRQHFEDLKIAKPSFEPEFYSLWRLLIQTAPQGKSENIPPNVSGEFMQAILRGTPYPHALLSGVVRRVKSDSDVRVNAARAALIKACLNRLLRYHPNPGEKELQMALDSEQVSIGYQLGRLMAALEKIQEEANPGLNATITDRYYGAACSTPVTVFGTLMRLMRYHMNKLDSKGRKIYFEQLIGEITSHILEYPAHLNLNEQGKFAVGYYHQKQAFYTKKESE